MTHDDEATVQPAVGTPVDQRVVPLVPERARLAGDVARCPGYGTDDGWREGCDDCRRRTSPPVDPERVWMMAPPSVVVFECEARIAP